MSIKTDKAAQNHQKGYNCAQAVACAFAEEMGIDESIIFKMMEGHGLGMGCMEGTCGAITGAVAVIGAIKSCGDIEKPVSKAATYKLTGELVKRFQEKNQATKFLPEWLLHLQCSLDRILRLFPFQFLLGPYILLLVHLVKKWGLMNPPFLR